MWRIDPVHTKIRFDAKYLMITDVSGWFRELEGTVKSVDGGFGKSSISLTIYTNSIFTGVDDRDAHLRSPDFFDAKQYPTIQFNSTSVQVRKDRVHIKGVLTIKGISHEIKFTASYLGSVPDSLGNTKAAFELDMIFNRKDFDISWNQYFDKQGVLISDKVQVHADIQLLKMPG